GAAAHLVVVLVAVHRVDAALAPHEVVAGTAVHSGVLVEGRREPDGDRVRADIARQRAVVADHVVAPGASAERVALGDRVGAGAAERIGGARDVVVAGAAGDAVVAGAAEDLVAAAVAANRVVALLALQLIALRPAVDVVVAGAAGDCVHVVAGRVRGLGRLVAVAVLVVAEEVVD